MKRKLKRYYYKLYDEMINGTGDYDTDHPDCPRCSSKMKIHGHDENGDFEIGKGYWECSSCRFKFTEDDIYDSVE